jgi:hypothetical protein
MSSRGGLIEIFYNDTISIYIHISFRGDYWFVSQLSYFSFAFGRKHDGAFALPIL